MATVSVKWLNAVTFSDINNELPHCSNGDNQTLPLCEPHFSSTYLTLSFQRRHTVYFGNRSVQSCRL